MSIGSCKRQKPGSIVAYLKRCDWPTRTVITAWSYCAQNILCLGSRVNCIDLIGNHQESIGLKTKYMEAYHV